MGEVNVAYALLSFEGFFIKEKKQDSVTVPNLSTGPHAQQRTTHVCCLNNQMNKQTPMLVTKIFNNYQGLNYSIQESILILLNLPE